MTAGPRGSPLRLAGMGLIGLSLLATALVGCSSQTRHNWLTVFFEGVPAPGARTNQVAAPVPVSPGGARASHLLMEHESEAVPAVPPRFTKHPPFEERRCGMCHESRFSVTLKGTQPQVCFGCHKDFLTDAKVTHLPVEEGECTACHQPHGSANPRLLKNAGADLCWNCHSTFAAKAKGPLQSIHPPVLNGQCLRCHAPHVSANRRLLLKAPGQVCFDCHPQEKVEALAAHRGAGAIPCVKCHNPHASTLAHLMKPDAPKVASLAPAAPPAK